MTGFVKIDTGILQSSLWIGRDTRSLFLTGLFMAEPFELTDPAPQLHVRDLRFTGWTIPPGWYGFIRAAGTAIIAKDGIADMEQGLCLLEQLCAPDPDSRSADYEGRRLARIDGGYIVLNYFKYRDRDFGAADRMRRLRQRRRHGGSAPGLEAGLEAPTVTPNARNVTANKRNGVTRKGGVTANVTHSRGQRAENRGTTPATTSTSTRKKPRVTWLTPYLDVWREAMPKASTAAIAGQLARYLAPLLGENTPEAICDQLRKYLRQTPPDFARPAAFAGAFGQWTGKRNGKAPTSDNGVGHLDNFVRRHRADS